MEIDWKIIDSHEQKFENSCIPSAVEMVLKLLKKVDSSYYDQQSQWEKIGSFAYYDGRTIEGVTFKLRNKLTVDELFAEIDRELKENKCVIISLKSILIDPRQPPNKCHMYVIYDYNEKKKDYKAFTKN
jgi:hypothetical protein